MNETPIAYWLLLTAKDTPEPLARAWAASAQAALAPSAPGWDTRVVTAGDDFVACAPQSRGRPDWGAWVEGVPSRYGGLVVPLTSAEIVVGRATSDILEAAQALDEPPHLMGWSPVNGTLHTLVSIKANWKGDERPWKAWSVLRFEGWPARAAPVRVERASAPTRPAKPQPAQSDDVADFLALCDGTTTYAESVLSGRRGDAAGAFLESVTEKIRGMREWAEEHDHATAKMVQAVENIANGVSKWER